VLRPRGLSALPCPIIIAPKWRSLRPQRSPPAALAVAGATVVLWDSNKSVKLRW